MKHQEKLKIYRTPLEAGESLRVARMPKSAGPLRLDEIERAYGKVRGAVARFERELGQRVAR